MEILATVPRFYTHIYTLHENYSGNPIDFVQHNSGSMVPSISGKVEVIDLDSPDPKRKRFRAKAPEKPVVDPTQARPM